MEKTFFIIKPDGVRRGLVGKILERIENRTFSIERLEVRQADEALLRQHYSDLVERPFFPQIVDYMTSGPMVIGIISGNHVIETWRTMMGATNPKDAALGSIRGDFAQAPGDNEATLNIVHGSDSKASAQREIALWFADED
ncbi:nucleoside-diphosphate kinase [Streptococcus sp. zg-JUN1979]|uniref:nucleoside-diphosphate kinase n=1 Tax=Streptococcus sp. zg-JUN1979 TaxID=3391450 RepID=UPI0039A5B242